MSDVFANAIAAMETTLRAMCPASITYCRGTTEIELTAYVGRTEQPTLAESGVQTVTELRDYFITVTDLVDGTTLVVPRAGDTIEEEMNGVIEVYAVLPVEGEGVSRYTDHLRTTYRVHAKHARTEAIPEEPTT